MQPTKDLLLNWFPLANIESTRIFYTLIYRELLTPVFSGGLFMKKIFSMVMLSALFLCLLSIPSPSARAGELDSFIQSLNIEANADFGAFKARLSASFGVPVPEINVLISNVETPADAYMCLKAGQIAKQPADIVLREYKANKGKGWGVIAKNLGIKPGSKEFHELKRGDFAGGKESGESTGKGKMNGKGKGRGK